MVDELNEFDNREEIIDSVKKKFDPINDIQLNLISKIINNGTNTNLKDINNLISDNENPASLCAEFLKLNCNPDRKTVAIIYQQHMWAQLGDDFVKNLNDSGFNCLLLSLNPKLGVASGFFKIDAGIFRMLDFIDVCIGYGLPLWITWGDDWMADLDVIDIDRTSRNYLHGHPEIWQMRFGKYIVRPVNNTISTEKNKSIRSDLKIPANSIGSRRNTYVLPLVPNKYERIRSIRKNLKPEEINNILVCPTQSDVPEYFIPKFGHELFSGLLNKFPDYNIVFRPRPEDRNNKEVIDIINKYSSNSKFIYDNNDDYVHHYARGIVLITDRSSTGQTFTIATHQPSLYFPLNDGFIGVPIKELLNVGCFKLKNLNDIFRKVEEIIESPSKQEIPISQIAERAYEGNFSFQDKFIEYLNYIVRNNIHPDWYHLSLTEENIVSDDIQGYEQSLNSIYNIFKDHNGYTIVQGFQLLVKYIQLNKKNKQPIPENILENALKHHVTIFKRSHSSYHTLDHVIRLILHNMGLNIMDKATTDALKTCVDLIFKSGNEISINKLKETLDKNKNSRIWMNNYLPPDN